MLDGSPGRSVDQTGMPRIIAPGADGLSELQKLTGASAGVPLAKETPFRCGELLVTEIPGFVKTYESLEIGSQGRRWDIRRRFFRSSCPSPHGLQLLQLAFRHPGRVLR
jgi:hypothetical protein